MTDEQAALIIGQYASSMANQIVRKTNFAQERLEKRQIKTQATFQVDESNKPAKKRKRDDRPRYFTKDDDTLKVFNTQGESFFFDSPNASTSSVSSVAAMAPFTHSNDQFSIDDVPGDLSVIDTSDTQSATEPQAVSQQEIEPVDFTTGPLPFGITESDLRDIEVEHDMIV